MRDQKTPLKESSRSTPPDRRSKSAEAPSKKPAQVPKKSSSVEGTSKKSIDPSSVSEGSDINRDDETAEMIQEMSDMPPSSQIITQAFDPSPSVGSVSPDLSFSSEMTVDYESFLLETCDSSKPGNSKFGSFQAIVSATLLMVAQAQVLKSLDLNHQSMKLLERAIMNQVDGLNNPPAKIGGLASSNIRLFFFGLLLWILAMSVFFFFCSESQTMSFGSPPT